MLFFILILQVYSQENVALVRSLICGDCSKLSTDDCLRAEWCEILCSDLCEFNNDTNKCTFKLKCSEQNDKSHCSTEICIWNDETCSENDTTSCQESCANKELDFNCSEYEQPACSENDWCEWNSDASKCNFKKLLQCSDQIDESACLAFSSICRWNTEGTCSAYSPKCQELLTQEGCQSYFQDNMQCIWKTEEEATDETTDQTVKATKTGRCLKSQKCDNYEEEQCQLLANCNMDEGKCADCTKEIYKQYASMIGFQLLLYFYNVI